jgi:lipopolysaccharide export system permease protein
MVVIKPNNLSMWSLYSYIRYLDSNRQNSLQYQQALWFKLFYPLGAAAMVFLAVPIVLATGVRTVAVGQRIVVGASIALGFHIFNKAVGYLGLVFNLYPAFSVTLPTLLTIAIAALLMRRIN